ncbi:MAG: hypothetical protein QXK06_05220 [Candidatus Diapherotrites archaeon]
MGLSKKDKKRDSDVTGKKENFTPNAGSKKFLFAIAVFLVLVIALAFVFFSGFFQSTGTEAEAIAFADETAFGKVALFYEDLFVEAKKCDFEKFVSFAEKHSGVAVTEEDKDEMRPYFESASKCIPSLSKKAEKKADWKFDVLYSIKVPASCDDNTIAGFLDANKLGIESVSLKVDLKEKKAELPPLPEDSVFSSWQEELEKIETELKNAEELGGKDTKAVLGCSLTGSMAMYKYFMDALDGMGGSYGE